MMEMLSLRSAKKQTTTERQRHQWHQYYHNIEYKMPLECCILSVGNAIEYIFALYQPGVE